MLCLSPFGRLTLVLFPCMSYGRRHEEIWVEGLHRPPSEGHPAADLGLQEQPSGVSAPRTPL